MILTIASRVGKHCELRTLQDAVVLETLFRFPNNGA